MNDAVTPSVRETIAAASTRDPSGPRGEGRLERLRAIGGQHERHVGVLAVGHVLEKALGEEAEIASAPRSGADSWGTIEAYATGG